MSILRQMWRPFFPQLSISMVMYLLDGKKCKLKHLPVGLLRNPRQIWSLGSMKLCLRRMSGVQTQADWLLVVSGYSSMCVEERVRSWRQNLDPSVRGFDRARTQTRRPGAGLSLAGGLGQGTCAPSKRAERRSAGDRYGVRQRSSPTPIRDGRQKKWPRLGAISEAKCRRSGAVQSLSLSESTGTVFALRS